MFPFLGEVASCKYAKFFGFVSGFRENVVTENVHKYLENYLELVQMDRIF